ncbi:MAG: DUF1573 domain-containing protein [Pirellulales bacterium]|nr:DUF1573 domain-containing protein [Pirellulales bacterium]
MFCKLGLIGLLTAAVGLPASAQEWARKMFQENSHDFGTVARSAKAEYRFVFENIYLEDVHVAGVRTSCSCTSPTVENPTVKTYEKGAILAHFNTNTFLGQHGATLTVTIDKPYYAQVQLHVKGNIRSDVLVEPGSVQFGTVEQGTAWQQYATVNYQGGNPQWKITGVKSLNPHVKPQIVETSRNYGQATYKLNVVVDRQTPPGYLNEPVLLTTNDPQNPQIPVLVEGRIESGVSVSPATLFMGVVQPGQKVTKQLIVKSKKPFKILSITCDDKSFELTLPAGEKAKPVHVIPITFVAGADPGRVVKTIRILTDQGTKQPQLSAYAVVAKQ